MTNFLEILLEAKGDKPASKKIKIKPKKEDDTDYTAEAEDTPEEEETETDDVEEADDDTVEDETEDTDYTQMDEEADPETDGADPEEEPNEEGDDDSTDYTSENDDNDTNSDESGEQEDSSDEESTEEGDNNIDSSEKTNNRLIIEDIINLYYSTKNTISKLSNIDKSNIAVNMIVAQISDNLEALQTQVYEYTTKNSLKAKYIANLMKYNYFLEAYRINVEMLKKISVFGSN